MKETTPFDGFIYVNGQFYDFQALINILKNYGLKCDIDPHDRGLQIGFQKVPALPQPPPAALNLFTPTSALCPFMDKINSIEQILSVLLAASDKNTINQIRQMMQQPSTSLNTTTTTYNGLNPQRSSQKPIATRSNAQNLARLTKKAPNPPNYPSPQPYPQANPPLNEKNHHPITRTNIPPNPNNMNQNPYNNVTQQSTSAPSVEDLLNKLNQGIPQPSYQPTAPSNNSRSNANPPLRVFGKHTIKCPHCNTDLPPNSVFCYRCRTPLGSNSGTP